MTDTKEQLKPCPMCGEEGEYREIDSWRRVVIRCKECCSQTQMYADNSSAKAAWNARPIEDALQQQNQDMREALEQFNPRRIGYSQSLCHDSLNTAWRGAEQALSQCNQSDVGGG